MGPIAVVVVIILWWRLFEVRKWNSFELIRKIILKLQIEIIICI